MKYIIMCGFIYKHLKYPKQLLYINDNEQLIQRTIRQLKEHGIDDIAISTNVPEQFKKYDVDVITMKYGHYWCDGFYLTDEPVCYIFGDVVFSDDAIKTIVETETDDIEFFASSPPFAKNYYKEWAEPFAFKVVNTEHFKEAIQTAKQLYSEKVLKRNPIAWEIWQIIKHTALNRINYKNYTAINDYTCDIDKIDDLAPILNYMKRGG